MTIKAGSLLALALWGSTTSIDSCAQDAAALLDSFKAAALPLGQSAGTQHNPNALVVGGLPVTCNLTLPVACAARATSNGTATAGAPKFAFEFSKYNGWPEIKESGMIIIGVIGLSLDSTMRRLERIRWVRWRYAQ
jgi:hypothetical protein